jgi:hypothetical protein
MIFGFKTKTTASQSIGKVQDLRVLREVERILVDEHETAMTDFTQSRWNPAIPDSSAACDRSIAAMRRLGAFLKSREIPADIAQRFIRPS